MVQFNIHKTKQAKKYGIYVKSISGIALAYLGATIPELDSNMYGLYSDIETKELVKKGALLVRSNRVFIYDTEKQASKKVKELNSLNEVEAIQLVINKRISFTPIEKNFVAAKLQYFQLHREVLNEERKQFSTQDKEHAERVALQYSDMNVQAKLKKTVSRNVLLSVTEFERVKNIVEETKQKGKDKNSKLSGFTADIKDQGANYSRRIGQKRKSTTKLSFWNKYK